VVITGNSTVQIISPKVVNYSAGRDILSYRTQKLANGPPIQPDQYSSHTPQQSHCDRTGDMLTSVVRGSYPTTNLLLGGSPLVGWPGLRIPLFTIIVSNR
jgi:hypothetical protein